MQFYIMFSRKQEIEIKYLYFEILLDNGWNNCICCEIKVIDITNLHSRLLLDHWKCSHKSFAAREAVFYRARRCNPPRRGALSVSRKNFMSIFLVLIFKRVMNKVINTFRTLRKDIFRTASSWSPYSDSTWKNPKVGGPQNSIGEMRRETNIMRRTSVVIYRSERCCYMTFSSWQGQKAVVLCLIVATSAAISLFFSFILIFSKPFFHVYIFSF